MRDLPGHPEPYTVARTAAAHLSDAAQAERALIRAIFAYVEAGDIITIEGLAETLVVGRDWWGDKFAACPGTGVRVFSESEGAADNDVALRALFALRSAAPRVVDRLERVWRLRHEARANSTLQAAHEAVLAASPGTGYLTTIDSTTYLVVNVPVADSAGQLVDMRRAVARAGGDGDETVELVAPLTGPLQYVGVSLAPTIGSARFLSDAPVILEAIAQRRTQRRTPFAMQDVWSRPEETAGGPVEEKQPNQAPAAAPAPPAPQGSIQPHLAGRRSQPDRV